MATWSKQDLRLYDMKRTPPEKRQADADAKSERELQETIIQYLRMKGVLAIVHSRMDKRTTQSKGVADIICAVNGRALALEVKVGTNKPTDEQTEWLCDAQSDGWVTRVVYRLEDAIEAYREAAKV